MRVVLVHVRDPQFYAIPRRKTPKSGRLQVMGFPPIGIMSLSSVLKRAGHDCFIFDQANPATPNDVIVSEIRRIKPHLVGLSFLSTTSYPYAKVLARMVRAADSDVKIAFGGVFASLNAQLVKLHCFAGLTIEQAAELLGISARTAYRDWAYARGWLFRAIEGGRSGAAG